MWQPTRIGNDRMTCQEVVELVTDYLEGAMPAEDRHRFEAHLDGCTGCRRYLAQMRRTIGLVGEVRAEDLPAEMQDDLIAAFRSWKSAG